MATSLLCELWRYHPVPHPFQAADAAVADGLHQLIVGRSHRRRRPAALLPSSVHHHGSQRVLELLQDATRLLPARPLRLRLLAFFTLRLRAGLLAAGLVRLDDLRDHPCGLLLVLREGGRGRRWRRRRRRRRRRWWGSGGSLFLGGVTSGEFGRGPRRRARWWPRRSPFLEIEWGGGTPVIASTLKVGTFSEPPHMNYLSHKCPVKMPNYQLSGSGVHRSLWCRLLLPLLLQPPLSLAILVPGQDPRHAHPGTREVELVAQLDQGVVFPQYLHHFHLDLWEGSAKGHTRWKTTGLSAVIVDQPVPRTCVSGCESVVP